MKLIGKTQPGELALSLTANTKRTNRLLLVQGIRVPKATVLLDGLGPGDGEQPARVEVYDYTGQLIATSEETVIGSDQGPIWADFPFAESGGVAMVPADGSPSYEFDCAVHGGEPGDVIRLYGDAGAGNQARLIPDSYGDGPTNPIGAGAALTTDLSLYLTYITPWLPPDTADDFYFASLPFSEAQDQLSRGGPLQGSSRSGRCGWHGDEFDPERGSYAVAATGGPLADLVGERLQITRRDSPKPRSVYVFCHTEAEMPPDEDLSLPLRAFSVLGVRDTVPVSIEVME